MKCNGSETCVGRVLGVSFSLVMLLAAGNANAREWPLFCKGPVAVMLKQRPTGFMNAGAMDIQIDYRNPNKAAGQRFENLAPGECSWPDRALNSREGSCAVLSYSNLTESGFEIQYQVGADGSLAPRMRVVGGTTADRLLDLRQQGRNVKIYIDGWSGCGKATRLETP